MILLKFLFCILMYFEVQILGKLAIQGQFNNQIWISYTNAFSSGLFLAVGIIHILSESNTILEEYYDYPIAYLLAILGFSLVLYIEKIYFRNIKENVNSEENIELQLMNKQDNHQGVILESHEQKQTQQLVNSLKNNKNNLRPYLLSIAIGIHAVFEGLALGVSRYTSDTLGLGLSLMAHKWAEGWALGVAFRESSAEKEIALKFIVIQAALSPVGVSLGMMVAGESILMTGIVQSFTAGTFVYIATTELIVEEFNKQDNQVVKFILYMLGIAFISLLVYLE